MDAWRLSVGTLTTVPIGAPIAVGSRVAASAMVLAPVTALLLAVPAGMVFWIALVSGTGSLVAAVLVVVTLRLGDRAFHLDGLADTADGLAASYDRERSLAVMRTGDTGPAGVVAVVMVLMAQIAGAAHLGTVGLAGGTEVAAGAGVAGSVVVSRAMLTLGCVRGVPAARPDGLGAVVAGTVGRLRAAGLLLLVSVIFGGVLLAADPSAEMISSWSAPVALGVAGAATALVLRRCIQRFGGISGDVLGAIVEMALAASLLTLAALAG
ncbi:adenosylcobinamide-GDP ribazoletransferase [Actinobacteria bacterium YIM 96077]|uniref:Adenosylcobinamide-GDP ribazoletransferase n=2 Tax=Phytoactinopolyspora halophila TaxID=1981511 RepID=A0A329QRJ0_9ACTN|nr:adenosylcobinamide-GDP ribazoletransferase [Actinobacteria bacterium YIM 96077]RAW14229.1 adenosylcobinamide-GDP ribazoletransferase [Phytoactinopolyspora halophila]